MRLPLSLPRNDEGMGITREVGVNCAGSLLFAVGVWVLVVVAAEVAERLETL